MLSYLTSINHIKSKSYYLLEIGRSSILLIVMAFTVYIFNADALFYYQRWFALDTLKSMTGMLFLAVYSFCWLFVVPVLFNKWIRRETMKDIGICLPENNVRTWLLILAALALLVPFMIYFASDATFQSYNMGNVDAFHYISMIGIPFLIYYFSEECFMRGFLFLGLWKRIGWHSFWITDLLFTLFHAGKPLPEILLCIPASIIFNCLTLFTKSIVPAMIVHMLLGLILSVLVTFHLLQ